MSFNLLVSIPLVVLTLLGAVALVSGLRVHRRGDTPHCRRCDYVLTGLGDAVEQCPECGTALDAPNVVRGERFRTPRLALLGAVLLLLGLVPLAGLGWQAANRYDWSRVRPAGWLVDDVEKANSNRAMQELVRRRNAGSLGAAHRDRLIAVALAEQARAANGPLTSDMVEFLDTAADLEQLSDAQRKQFFDRSVQLTLQVSPQVGVGEPVSFTLNGSSRTAGGRRWVMIDDASVEAEGTTRPIGGSSKLSGTGAGGSTGSTVRAKTPGRHTLTVRARVRVYHGGDMDDRAATLDHERTVTLSAEYDVIDPADVPVGQLTTRRTR